MSRALRMMYGSHILRVVVTVMLPSITSSSAVMPCSARVFLTRGQHSRRYFSLYLGNRVAKALSQSTPCGLSSLVNAGSRMDQALSAEAPLVVPPCSLDILALDFFKAKRNQRP
uniref:Putative secreted protein n=1 Tax=Amblyomma tuberculatum TaxID=48802 RepID=A0A6M2E1T4_9ACAR